jgi:perosamine synthetase
MTKKFYPVAEPNFLGNEKKYIMDCVDSTWVSSRGKYIDLFEKEFANKIGVKHAITTSNGTVSLHLIMEAMDIGKGDEVIIPNFTYVASANAVKYTGAEPVFIDIREDDLNMDVNKIEEKINEKTKAIMVVHIFGNPCNMEKIEEIATRNNIPIIEDSAESLGSEFNNKKTGNLGIAGSFSFFGNKTITCGEGGMITTNDDELNRKIRLLKNHGQSEGKTYSHEIKGYNYRMTNMQAALGLAQLEKLDELVNKKIEINSEYKKNLKNLEEKGIIRFQKDQENGKNTYWMTVIVLNEKLNPEVISQKLKEKGIETKPLFVPMDKLPFLDNGNYPVSERIYQKGIVLPSGTTLIKDDIISISKEITKTIEGEMKK